MRILCFTPTAVVTLHVAALNEHLGFAQFSHLRVLDITLDWTNHKSTKDIERASHSILAPLTSPALEHVRLELKLYYGARLLSTQDMHLRDATTDTYRAQYADLHTVLARPIFSSLHCVTVALNAFYEEDSVPAKDVALEYLDFLRALFAPWCVRCIISLACVITDSPKRCVDAVVDEGKGLRFIKRSGYAHIKPLADLGLQRHWPE